MNTYKSYFYAKDTSQLQKKYLNEFSISSLGKAVHFSRISLKNYSINITWKLFTSKANIYLHSN